MLLFHLAGQGLIWTKISEEENMPIKGQCNFCLVCLSCYVHVLLLVVISLLVDMVDVNSVDDTCS